jgi:phosphatidylinositol phospholipase C, delta
MVEYTSKFLLKVYPSGGRVDSSNLTPTEYWSYGIQIAALNFQTRDTAMLLNAAMFNDNGKCGYVLKPEILRNPALKFNPNDTRTMNNKRRLEIKIISAQRLPQNTDIVKDISDPFVSISIYGVPADINEQKTSSIKDNGFNPIWNQDFKFLINCPELAFIRFNVKDKDVGKDQTIGTAVIRFENMRLGYRHINLVNRKKQGTLFVGIRCIKID